MGFAHDRRMATDEGSVAGAEKRWRAVFVAVFLLLSIFKGVLAWRLQPFVDEAFYWQESRHLAWGYSDLPPLTAWLIRLGEALAGHGPWGMRWPFLLLGMAWPWLLVAFARRAFGDACAAWQAGLGCLLLPLAGTLGVLALPDVPLTFAAVLAIYAQWRAASENRLWQWGLLGIALALGFMTHYRGAMPALTALVFGITDARRRRLWRGAGPWLAVLLAALGLVPLVISNWQQRGASLAFQLVERNPWRFHADALAQPLEQALACTPVLYGLLLWAAWQAWRRRRETAWHLIATQAIGFLGLYFVLGLFADDLRFRAHWPLPGYLPLMAALAVLVRERGAMRGALVAGCGLAALGLSLGLAWLGLAAGERGPGWLAGSKLFPSHFVGWREAAREATRLPEAAGLPWVADNFMLAAELDFATAGRHPIYVLDNPLNAKHGRAVQVALWRRDETALRAEHAGDAVLLVVDETAVRERDRLAWLGSLCARLVELRPRERLELFAGAKPIAFYLARVPVNPPVAGDPAACVAWRAAHAARYGE